MSPDEKKSVAEIVDKHEKYSICCLLEIHENFFIARNDFQSICMCVEFPSKDPAHLDRGVLTLSEVVAVATEPKLEAVQASTKGINDGLN